MRLIPTDLHGADRPDVEAVDVTALEQVVDEGLVLSDGGNDEAVADAAQHFALRNLQNTGVRAKELAVGERVLVVGAPDDGRAQEGAALEFGFAWAVAELRGHIFSTGGFEVVVDGAVDVVSHFDIGEASEAGVFVFGGRRHERAETLGECGGDFLAVFRHDDRRSVDAGTSAVVADGGDHDIEVILPVLDLVLADDDLAPARAMNLHTRIALVHLCHGHVAEDKIATAEFDDFATAFVIGGIKTKGFWRCTCGDEGLDEAKRRPGLLTARLDDHRDLQGDGGQPE